MRATWIVIAFAALPPAALANTAPNRPVTFSVHEAAPLPAAPLPKVSKESLGGAAKPAAPALDAEVAGPPKPPPAPAPAMAAVGRMSLNGAPAPASPPPPLASHFRSSAPPLALSDKCRVFAEFAMQLAYGIGERGTTEQQARDAVQQGGWDPVFHLIVGEVYRHPQLTPDQTFLRISSQCMGLPENLP